MLKKPKFLAAFGSDMVLTQSTWSPCYIESKCSFDLTTFIFFKVTSSLGLFNVIILVSQWDGERMQF